MAKGKKKKSKSKRPQKTAKQIAYEKQWKRINERVKKLEGQGYNVDTSVLPRKKRAMDVTIAELRKYNIKKLRKYSTKERDGEIVTAEKEFKEEQRQKREAKKEEKRRQEEYIRKVEEDRETQAYHEEEDFINDYLNESYDNDTANESDESEDYEDTEPEEVGNYMPSEAESILDSLYDLLDGEYYEKDKKHKSSFTEEATENMEELRDLLDEISERIADGDIDLYNRINDNFAELQDLIWGLTRDYKTATFYPDFALFRINEIMGDTTSYTSDSVDTNEYYSYHSSSEDE